MKFSRYLKDRLKASRSEESGFTMIELVVSIPITILIFGTVFATIGTAILLQTQVTEQVVASRTGRDLVDQLSATRNCTELNSLLAAKAADTSTDFAVSFGNYTYSSCVNGKTVIVPVILKGRDDNRVYYNQTLNLAAM